MKIYVNDEIGGLSGNSEGRPLHFDSEIFYHAGLSEIPLTMINVLGDKKRCQYKMIRGSPMGFRKVR